VKLAPAPWNYTGISIPIKPWSNISLSKTGSILDLASISLTLGAMLVEANLATADRNCCSSSVKSDKEHMDEVVNCRPLINGRLFINLEVETKGGTQVDLQFKEDSVLPQASLYMGIYYQSK